MPEVRQAGAGDLAAVKQLLHDTWHATYDGTMGKDAVDDITARWHSMENLSRDLSDPNGCFLVAETADGEIIGHAGASRESDSVVRLARLYVLPERQGCGAGAALLKAVTEWAGHNSTIELEVETANSGAIDFYRKHGFSTGGDTVQCGGDPAAGQALIMTRCPS